MEKCITCEVKSFYELLDSFLLFKRNQVKESTYSRYLYIIEHYIKININNFYLENYGNDIINSFTNELLHKNDNKLSNKTVKDILVLMSSIFTYGKNISVVKYDNTVIGYPKPKKNEISIFKKYELKIIVDYCLSNKRPYTLGVLLTLFTGLRIGEICALKWSDIDFNNKILKVSKTLQRIKNFDGLSNKTKIIITDPKSFNGYREIPLNDIIINELCSYYDNNNDCYVLTNTKKYLEPSNCYIKFSIILRKLNIEHRSFHSLRHTFASIAVERGFDVKSLSEILGHSNVQITLNTYVHSSIELKRKNMELITMF